MKQVINMEKTITIVGKGQESFITCREDESILEALLRQNIYVSAVCGSRGTCGKCKIRLLEGNLEITQADEKKLKPDEIRKGYRLSCKAYPKEDCRIRLCFQGDEDFEVLTEAEVGAEQKKTESAYAIAIDIGTTTLSMALIGIDSGDTLHSYAAINRQRAYGSDVISRIQASNEGKKEELQHSIQTDLLTGIRTIIKKSGIKKENVRQVAIGGNTTMGHLLMGYSCEHLGVFPFRPVNIGTITESFETVFKESDLLCPVTLLPGISTYVGGDILAGLLACGFDENEKISLLIDLGTNGEMAIGNKDKILVTSTAAGPAFEGGNISCGMGSVAGAVCSVKLNEKKTLVRTIGNKPPIGLCGSGVIEIAAELIRAGLVDETGLLDEAYFNEGFPLAETYDSGMILFTQKDVREIQLAKSAVRAGIETLLLRYKVTYEQIDTVYLAGGFGFHLDQQKAIRIGLLPKAFEHKMKTVGNSSLAGAAKYILDPKAKERTERILTVSMEVDLSTDLNFNEMYMEHMFFESDI